MKVVETAPKGSVEGKAWEAAAPLVEHRIAKLESSVATVTEAHGVTAHTVVVMRDRQTWMLAGLGTFIAGVFGVGLWVASRWIVAELETSAVTAREERLAAIQDVVCTVRRNKDGSASVYALQQALPAIRGISRLERDAVMARMPEGCP